MHQPRTADLFEDFTRTHLPPEEIYVAPALQPPNPEDEDDVVPDQHAAFGITRAMAGIARGGGGGGGSGGVGSSRGGMGGVGIVGISGSGGGGGGVGGRNNRSGGSGVAGVGNAGAFWRDLGLEEVVERGPMGGEEGVGVDFLMGAGAGGAEGAGRADRAGGRRGIGGRSGGGGGGAYAGRVAGGVRGEEPEQPIALAIRDKKTADDVRAR